MLITLFNPQQIAVVYWSTKYIAISLWSMIIAYVKVYSIQKGRIQHNVSAVPKEAQECLLSS